VRVFGNKVLRIFCPKRDEVQRGGGGGTEFRPDPSRKQSAKPLWHIPIAVCTVIES